MKAKPAGMSWAAWARANGMNPTTAGKIGLIPMEEATRYALGMGQEAPEPAPEKTWTPPVKRAKPKRAGEPKKPGKGHWTNAEDDRMVALLEQGMTQYEAGEVLGRSPRSVQHRVMLLGLSGTFNAPGRRKQNTGTKKPRPRDPKWWTEQEDETLRKAVRDGRSFAEIAEILSPRSKDSCKRRFRRIMAG